MLLSLSVYLSYRSDRVDGVSRGPDVCTSSRVFRRLKPKCRREDKLLRPCTNIRAATNNRIDSKVRCGASVAYIQLVPPAAIF